MKSIFEKWRPRSLDEIVGQPKAVEQVRRLESRGAISGRAYWISGASGTGKTTLARIIAGMVAGEWAVLEFDAADQVGTGEFDTADQWLKTYSLGKGGRAVIINEAHGLRKGIIRQLLGLLERLPEHTVVIFTTTKDGQDALFEDCDDSGPLLSRCIRIALTNQGLAKAFGARVAQIAREESLGELDEGAAVKLAQRCRNNFRAMLTELEAGTL